MDISAIILTWNSEKYIESSICSLIADCEGAYSYEIFIVDNGSVDSTKEVIQNLTSRYGDSIKPIFLKENYGTTYPRNLVMRKAKGNFLIIMDSDVEVGKGTISRLIGVLTNNKDVGIVAPKLIYSSGAPQKSTDVFPTIFTKIFRYFFLKVIEKKEKVAGVSSGPREVDYAISALWALRRDILEKVGLLDENIFYAPEDVDYCLRMWKAGYKVLYVPDVACVHHTQEISRGFRVNKAAYNHLRGLIYYFRKHGYLIRKPKITAK